MTHYRASTAHMVAYDQHSRVQNQIVRSKRATLEALVDAMGVRDGEFVLTDYGCGPGHSAVEAALPVIAAYRRLSADAPMIVRHADQPGNDWNALLAIVFGADGYQGPDARIRTEAVVGSFYRPMAAPGSVSLGTCFAASHWLSHSVELHAPGTVWFADLDGEARTTFAAAARADWVQFLRCRATELHAGGHLVVATLGSVPDAAERNGIRASARKLYRAIFEVADQMVRDGLLSRTALDRFVFGLRFPTTEEAKAPMLEEPDLAAVFEIVEASVSPAPLHEADAFADQLADPSAYADLYVGYVRGFGESSLRLHLFGQSSDDPAVVDRLTDAFFQRLRRLYADEPGKHASETMIVTLVLRRR